MPQVGRMNASNKTSLGVVSDAAGLVKDNKIALSKVKANRERRFMNRLLMYCRSAIFKTDALPILTTAKP